MLAQAFGGERGIEVRVAFTSAPEAPAARDSGDVGSARALVAYMATPQAKQTFAATGID